MSSEPDEILATLEQIERLVRRLRRQLDGTAGPAASRRAPRPRKVMLRDAALAALRKERWMSLDDWEAALPAHGYKVPGQLKRPDQTRRSLASLASRNRHLIQGDGQGRYRLAEVESTSWLTQ